MDRLFDDDSSVFVVLVESRMRRGMKNIVASMLAKFDQANDFKTNFEKSS